MLENLRNTILVGDCRRKLREIPPNTIHCVVTSPPYWGLRNYGLPPSIWPSDDPGCIHSWEEFERAGRTGGSNVKVALKGVRNFQAFDSSQQAFCSHCGAWRGCLGLEPDHLLYVKHIVEIMREVRRVLRLDGILWLNLGDSYATTSAGNTIPSGFQQKSAAGISGALAQFGHTARSTIVGTLKPKDLVGIPHRVAFALQDDGWWHRSDIIWAKTNPMPESVKDRPSCAYEYIFMMSKSARYFYDYHAVMVPAKSPTRPPRKKGGKGYAGNPDLKARNLYAYQLGAMAALNNIWHLPTANFKGKHFAPYPLKLVQRCIAASTSVYGCCYKCGAPWERVVKRHQIAERDDTGRTHGLDDQRLQSPGAPPEKGWESKYSTLGWRPTCTHYNDRYHYDFQRPRNRRKRMQRNAYPMRFERVRRLPGKEGWPRSRAVVLDPFMGSGTTAVAALKDNRDYIGIEINEEYAQIIEKRLAKVNGTQLEMFP